MKKRFFLSTVALLSLGMLAGCGGSNSDAELDIGEVKVWCDVAIKEITQGQLDAFKNAHPGYNVSFKIEEVGEGDAATQMIQDPQAGADLYFFAQDQLARLVQAGAIDDLAQKAVDEVVAMNDAGSVAAATYQGKVYAYPATSDNGYFMYYDKSVLEGVDLTDFAAIAARCKARGKTIYYNYGSGWYNFAFLGATGARCEYTLDAEGNYVAYNDTYETAVAAAQAMHDLVSDAAVFVDNSDSGAFSSGAAVLISGTWAAATVTEALGENLGATILPKVNIGGQMTQLTSFAGFKLVGTKKQTEKDRVIGIREIALTITGEAAQKERFEKKNWGPSNKNVQQLDEVKNNQILSAVFAQNALAVPQGQYPQAWWNLSGALGVGLADKNADVEELIAAYKAGLPGTLS